MGEITHGKRHKNNSKLEYGYSTRKGDCPEKTKNVIREMIRDKAMKAGLSETDIANLLAIADLESGFNPDAENEISSAKGIFQITGKTERDAQNRLKKHPEVISGYKWESTYKPYDPDSNIDVGIAVYLDKKRKARSDDIEKIYDKYNSRPTEAELHEIRRLYNKYKPSSSFDRSQEMDTDRPRMYASLADNASNNTNSYYCSDDEDYGWSIGPTVG